MPSIVSTLRRITPSRLNNRGVRDLSIETPHQRMPADSSKELGAAGECATAIQRGVSLMCLSTETIVCSGTYTRLRMLRESDGRCGRRCVDGRAFRISAPREVAVRGVGRCVVAPVRVLLHPANMIAVVRRAQSTRQPTGDCGGSEIPERASPPRCTAARMECMGCVRCEEWYQRTMQPTGRSRFALRGIFGRTFHETTLGGRSRDNLVASGRTRNGRKCLRGWLLSSGDAAQLLEIPADQVFVVLGVALITLIDLVATDRG